MLSLTQLSPNLFFLLSQFRPDFSKFTVVGKIHFDRLGNKRSICLEWSLFCQYLAFKLSQFRPKRAFPDIIVV